MDALVQFLNERSDALGILRLTDVERLLKDLFERPEWLLPKPYKIFYADEMQAPYLGFPVCDSTALRELETRLDRWIGEEIALSVDRAYSREKVQQAFTAYVSHLVKLAENALLSNLLADYHAIFWLVHSVHLAKHFSMVPRRVSALDVTVGRQQGDAIKYRIFAKWSAEMKEQMAAMVARVSQILDGEEERGAQFFRLLQENLLILTEEFISPDLRELKSFVSGYLHLDFQKFRDLFQRLQTLSSDLLRRDTTFRAAIAAFRPGATGGISLSALLDEHFQAFLFDHPAVETEFNRDEREQLRSVSRRLCEYTILHQLRRGTTWMAVTPEGDVMPVDRRGPSYSRSTRPVDFGKPGVVDPMIYRFGLMYDITAFSETLSTVAKAGRKGEINAYRQMLLFQRKIEGIAERHRLQFEKFLGDGALYTTRRALGLINAAIEVQRFYVDMRKKGFAFNKGIRLALNYGYYRLLPMKPRPDSTERQMEFYGPGVVELSRLTTGKAAKEIEEIMTFLVGHGYEPMDVREFFAPLAQNVDVVDRRMHARDFYAYINSNQHLVNEGIVASRALLDELSTELLEESRQLYRLRSPWASYLGYIPGIDETDYVGFRILGTVSLKGLDNVEVGEVVRFSSSEVDVTLLDNSEPLVRLLRQEMHEQPLIPLANSDYDDTRSTRDTRERPVHRELLVCSGAENILPGMVMMGEWDAQAQEIHHSIQIAEDDLQLLVSLDLPLTRGSLESQKNSIRSLYRRMSEGAVSQPLPLAPFRSEPHFVAYLIGDTVEPL